MSNLKVLLVDNHPIVREGLKSILKRRTNLSIVGELSNGLEIFDFLKSHSVDLIISEIDLPELNGLTAIRAVKKEYKNINVLILTHQPEEIYAISAFKAGASGYVSKKDDVNTLFDAINLISKGKQYLSNKTDKYIRYTDTSKSKTRLFKRLSTREVEVLKLLSVGKKNKSIAKELSINEKTVSTYKSRLFKKLNVTNIVDLVHQAKHHDLA